MIICNQKLIKVINTRNQSSVSLSKMHKKQNQVGDRTRLSFGNDDCSSNETSNQSHMDKGKSKIIKYLHYIAIYQHDKPKI